MDAFVLGHYKLLTLSDMAKELACGPGKIDEVCKRLGVKPVSVREQNENYILSVHKHKTAAQMAKAMGIKHEKYVEEICRALRVAPKPAEAPPVKRDTFNSPGAILGAWQYEGVPHYINPR